MRTLLIFVIVFAGMVGAFYAGKAAQLEGMRQARTVCMTGTMQECGKAQLETNTAFMCNEKYCWMEVL